MEKYKLSHLKKVEARCVDSVFFFLCCVDWKRAKTSPSRPGRSCPSKLEEDDEEEEKEREKKFNHLQSRQSNQVTPRYG